MQTTETETSQFVVSIQDFAQSIVDTVREPLLILDTSLRVQSVNRAFYRTFNVEAAETMGRRVYGLGDGQWDIPSLRTLLEDIIPDTTTFDDFEVEHVFPGIGRRIMMLNARRVYSPGNTTELLVLVMEDVTELRDTREIARKAQETLRQSEVKFHALADNMNQLAWMADATGLIFWYNQRWLDFTGTTLEQMLDVGWQKFHRPEYFDGISEKYADHIRRVQIWEDTFPLLGVNGKYRWFLSHASLWCWGMHRAKACPPPRGRPK